METKDDNYYNGLDKRTKEYKEWKDGKKQSEGLGDTIAKVTKATGIDKLTKFILGDDCGCDERRKKLNQKFAYQLKADCLKEEEYNTLHEFFERNPKSLKPSEQITLNKIYGRVFNVYTEYSNCSGCVLDMINRLRTVYNTYNEE